MNDTDAVTPAPIYSRDLTAGQGRLPALDGLRGIAVLMVILLHVGWLPWGGVGVDIFFVLSGFLITGILLDSKGAGRRGWRDYWRPFYIRRALRIFPLAFVAIAVVFVALPRLGLHSPVPAREQAWYWLYISNWWIGERSQTAWMLSHFWSLAVEEQFYLIWPWVVLLVSITTLRRIAVTLLIAALIFRVAIVTLPVPPQVGHTYEGLTLTRMDGLAVGSLLAVLARSEGGLLRWTNAALALFAIGSIGFVVNALMMPYESVSYVIRYTLIALTAGSVVVLALTIESHSFQRLLRARWLRWVGTVSYSAYVIHVPLTIELRERGVSAGPRAWLTIGITFLLAAISWYFFERPILGLKHKWAPPQRRVVLTSDLPTSRHTVDVP